MIVNRRRVASSLTLALAAILLLGLHPASVAAHAELESSVPAAGSAAAAAPDRLELRFSESVDPGLSSISLISAGGASVPIALPSIDPTDSHVLQAALSDPSDMQPGVYTVVWGAYSREDGHASAGSFTFSVGTGQIPEQESSTELAGSSWGIVGKWLELIGLVILTGLALFVLTSGMGLAPSMRPLRTAAALLAAIGLLGALISLRAREIAITGGEVLSSPHRDTLMDLLGSTYGWCWIARVGVLMVALAASWRIGGSVGRGIPLVLAACGFIGLVSIAISGHAGAVNRSYLAVTVDLLHLSAAAFWVGGLLGLLIVLTPDIDPVDARTILRRQGNRFVVAAILIVLAGLTSAYWHVDGRRSLRQTDYGRTLLVKVAIVALLLGVAYYNRRVLQGVRGRLDWVPVAVGAEFAIATTILLFSADLSQTAPAVRPFPVQIAARAIELSAETTVGGTHLVVEGVLTGDPTDDVRITVAPVEDLQRIIVRSTLAQTEDGTTIGDRFDATPVDGEPGVFVFPAGRLGIAGPWELAITVRHAGIADVTATVPVDTSQLATYGTRSVEDRWGGYRLTTYTALALVLAALMLAIGLGGLRRITGLEPLASGFLLAASLVIAGGFVVSAARGMIPVTPDHSIPNPADSSPGALTYAGDLYQLNCAICHGADGRGAGTANLAHLHGNAADLTGNRTGSQSDADLRYWIANGIPGTRMPAFDPALTADEQWQLVLLIRQLQQDARDAEANE